MKKLKFLTALLVFALVSCTSGSKQESGNDHTDLYVEENAVIDSHTSEISLDWAGVYEGVMPCADCEGIEVTIALKEDLTYISHYKYLGKGKEYEVTNEGPFTWNDDGNSISLQAESEATQYKVGENHIVLLDMDGEVNTGELADLYVLKKKM